MLIRLLDSSGFTNAEYWNGSICAFTLCGNACPRGLSLAYGTTAFTLQSQLCAEVERTLLVAFGSFPLRNVERANYFRVAGQA